jgi:crotonobetainyl-CoA:carnitine CoA-transferase CaiB-like acyl-CoA transferase
MIGVANDNLWRKFCAVAGLSAVVDDPRFRTNADRVAHRKETIGQVQSALAQHPVGYWNDALAGAGVPCAPINSIAQLLDHPHTRASGIIVEYEHQTAGRLKGVGHPVLIDGAEREAGLPPPVLGQHTDDVLGEMGLSVETIRDLRRARVIA